MAILLNDNLDPKAPKLLDNRESLNGQVPYTSVGQANQTVLKQYRSRGLINYISDGNDLHIYWYRDGVEDQHLVRLLVSDLGGTIAPSGLHNELDGLQGGDSTLDEYYHLTLEELQTVRNKIERTSQLINDGEGTDPFITMLDVHPSNALLDWDYYRVEDYKYRVRVRKFIINGVLHEVNIDTIIELDTADSSNDRIDLIVVNENDTVSNITGTPSANPEKPAFDSLTQLEATFIIVQTSTTEPAIEDTTLVYDENLGWSLEANGTSSHLKVTLDDTSITAYSGTKSIKFNKAPLLENAFFTLQNTFLKTDIDKIVLSVYIVSGSGTAFVVQVADSGLSSEHNNYVIVHNNYYGFDDTKIGEWQTIVIPISIFGLSSSAYDMVNVASYKSSSVFHVDKIFTQKGEGGSQQGDVIHNDTTHKQGGDPLLDEYYHLSKDQWENLDQGGGGNYTLPTASSSIKGGVKIGANLTMAGQVLSATGATEWGSTQW